MSDERFTKHGNSEVEEIVTAENLKVVKDGIRLVQDEYDLSMEAIGDILGKLAPAAEETGGIQSLCRIVNVLADLVDGLKV